MEAKEKIRSYIQEHFLFGSRETTFADGDSFLESGIIDSTGILELVAYVEGEFGIEVKDEELVPDNFDSVAKLIEYINRKKATPVS